MYMIKSLCATSFPALAERADSKHLVDTHPNQSAIPVVRWAKGAWMNHSFVQLKFQQESVGSWWLKRWLIFGVTSITSSIIVLQLFHSIATTIMCILIVAFFSHDNASLIMFSQLLGCILPIRPGKPQFEWALFAKKQYSMDFFYVEGIYPEPYVTCRFPSFQPRWFQGLVDAGSRCNQFFLSHQCCVQGAATWLKVKDVSGGSTSHELWHWKLTKLTPKPSLKLTVNSKFVPPFFCPKRKPDRIVSQPRISGANLYSVRVRCNFAIINFETSSRLFMHKTYGLLR